MRPANSDSDPDLVFVYGTLRRGCSNHSLLQDDATFLGYGETFDRFTMINLGPFPAVIVGRTPGGPSTVKGELYEVDRATLARLDRLEGVPALYRRMQVQVETEGGSEFAWMYYQPPRGQQAENVILSGDWLKRNHE